MSPFLPVDAAPGGKSWILMRYSSVIVRKSMKQRRTNVLQQTGRAIDGSSSHNVKPA
jgi:hypothetical protein